MDAAAAAQCNAAMSRHLPLALTLTLVAPAVAQRQQSTLADLAHAKLVHQYDKDRDGRVQRAEYPRGDAAFANLDRDGDGVVTRADFDARPRSRQPRAPGRADRRSAGSRTEPLAPPAVGDLAPDFTLPLLGMTEPVKLSSFRGKQPVALIFGSYT